MGRKYFGTDGVRGRVGQFPITPDFVMRLGYSAGRVLLAALPPWQLEELWHVALARHVALT